ncbi:dephospho-CoA kinase [Flavobacterium sp. F-380]|uniref:Dephospho-CoA kinase n=1 Tax=Flavobacterium kayseriense TaxID=2764714 RepID=A0ABR7JB12_9FLAO|nr:dephospho-CoA kinase [Flavobacterium kayseriense]MBC5842727.1 dephospho-CoA kinase [Flavobacterium kayseriense]MBC5849257.1 dephospho-CoA kinase [Flavobacterium kayseriense]
MAKIIGLTGGIGSGKTTIAKFFASEGVPIYIADLEAKSLMDSKEIKKEIFELFGKTVFKNEMLDRAKIAEIVFNDPSMLVKLNSIVHPAVKKHFKEWVHVHESEDLLLYESAILFESGHYKEFDYVISVIAPLESRIARVLARDDSTREQVMSRVNAQWNDDERIKKSDFIIENINLDDSKLKVMDILKILKIKQNE